MTPLNNRQLHNSLWLLCAVLHLLVGIGSAWAGVNSGRPSTRPFHSGQATDMLTLINQARGEARTCGDKEFTAAAPLQWNEKLADAALKHAEDMARRNYFSHTSRNGSTLVDRVKRAMYDYRKIGENIASTTDAASTVALWLKSPGHCSNIMDPDFTEMGAAFASSSAKEWETRWVQVLGKGRKP